MSHEKEQAPAARSKFIIGTLGAGALAAALLGRTVFKGGKAAARVGTEIAERAPSSGISGRTALSGGRMAARAATKSRDRDDEGRTPPPHGWTVPAGSP
jgi:hypothetical protein